MVHLGTTGTGFPNSTCSPRCPTNPQRDEIPVHYAASRQPNRRPPRGGNDDGAPHRRFGNHVPDIPGLPGAAVATTSAHPAEGGQVNRSTCCRRGVDQPGLQVARPGTCVGRHPARSSGPITRGVDRVGDRTSTNGGSTSSATCCFGTSITQMTGMDLSAQPVLLPRCVQPAVGRRISTIRRQSSFHTGLAHLHVRGRCVICGGPRL